MVLPLLLPPRDHLSDRLSVLEALGGYWKRCWAGKGSSGNERACCGLLAKPMIDLTKERSIAIAQGARKRPAWDAPCAGSLPWQRKGGRVLVAQLPAPACNVCCSPARQEAPLALQARLNLWRLGSRALQGEHRIRAVSSKAVGGRPGLCEQRADGGRERAWAPQLHSLSPVPYPASLWDCTAATRDPAAAC